MAASFPVTFPSAVTTTPTTTLSSAQHNDNLHVKDRDEIIATQRKVGLGSSVASGTTVLLGTGGTQSAWGQITSTYIAAGSIATDRLAPASITRIVATVGTTSAPTTASSSYADLIVGTIVSSGGTIKAEAQTTVANNAANSTTTFGFKLNSGTISPADESLFGEATANLVATVSAQAYFAPSAGTHVVAWQWKVDSGTATAHTVRRRLTLTEVLR